MTASIERRVGHSLMAVRVVGDGGVEVRPLAVMSIEIVWDDRVVQKLGSRDGHVVIDQRRWTTDSATRSDGDAAQNISRTSPYAVLVGRELTALSMVGGVIDLDLDGARLSIEARGALLVLTVTDAEEQRQWWRVQWHHDDPDDPNVLYQEVVDGVERRKVEMWRDGRRGVASRFLELGGSAHAPERPPSLHDINVDPEFDGVAIAGDAFEIAWRAALADARTCTLWRPTGPAELRLVEESGWRRWPSRLPDQPIFYPVTTREYAERIAREWNVPDSALGFVTRFEVVHAFMDRYERHEAGGSSLTEWWVPAADLEDLNDHIVGTIDVVSEIRR